MSTSHSYSRRQLLNRHARVMDTDFSSSVQHVVANRLAAKNALRFTGVMADWTFLYLMEDDIERSQPVCLPRALNDRVLHSTSNRLKFSCGMAKGRPYLKL